MNLLSYYGKIRDRICVAMVNGMFVGTRWFGVKRWLLNRTVKCTVGGGTKVVGPIVNTAYLTIGTNCWVGADFRCYGNGKVTIGNNCDIAPQVSIGTGGHFIGDTDRRAGKGITNDVQIGNGCWLCQGSTIINQTTVGNGCIILPRACVINDVADNTMVGGVPAQIKKQI